MSFELVRGGDFSQASAGGSLCYVTGERKQSGDVGIFRGPTIDHEGFLDVSVRCITNAASQLNWISNEEALHLNKLIEEKDKTIERLREDLANYKIALKAIEEIGLHEFECPKCDFVGETEHGLKIHMGVKHS